MPAEQSEARIERLVAEMTIEEKVSMAAPMGAWFSTAVPRLGIPAYRRPPTVQTACAAKRWAVRSRRCFRSAPRWARRGT